MMTKDAHWQLGFVVGFAIGIIIGVVLGLTSGANAADPIDIEIGTIRGDPFELVFVAGLPAEVGDSCTGQVDARNNESTRDDTDIVLISAGTTVLTIAGVEAEGFGGAGIGFTANGPVGVYIRLGIEGLYSAGVFLEVTCNPPNTTTTVSPTTSSSTTTTTSTGPPLSTSSTVPPVTPTTRFGLVRGVRPDAVDPPRRPFPH